MKIDTNDKGEFILKEVYSGITLETDDNTLSICMRDNGFEIIYNNKWYEAKGNAIEQMGVHQNIKPDDILEMDSYDIKQAQDKNLCLTEVYVSTPEKKYLEILHIIGSHSYTWDFKLTKKPVGQKQKQNYELIKHIYIEEMIDGGTSGKEFAGVISIEYNIGEYLQFFYND